MRRRDALLHLAAFGLLAVRRQTPTGFLVRGGRVVDADAQRVADVRVRGETIVEVGPGLEASGETVLDARGLLVLPGGIDPHAHLSPPWADDFESGSRAALAGGITTIGCMTSPREGESLEEALAREEQRIEREAIADIVLHPVVGPPTAGTADALRRLAASGQRSLKIFMVSPRFDENQAAYEEIIRLAGTLGMVTLIHCEDADILAETAQLMEAEGRTSLAHFAESRPVAAEVKAVERAIAIGERTAAPMYVVHLSSKKALDACAGAKARGLPFHVETRPLYLHFTDERFEGSDGPLYVGQPPLRKQEDVEALWMGIAEGTVDTLGSDHAPWTREQKLDPDLDIRRLRPGVANLQTMLPVFFSEGVVRRKLPLERFVAVTSTNAARLFGLHPQKGVIAPGADADLVLWDPETTRVVERSALFSRAGFSLFEGRDVTGWPVLTLRRGEIVHRDGTAHGDPGSGRRMRNISSASRNIDAL